MGRKTDNAEKEKKTKERQYKGQCEVKNRR